MRPILLAAAMLLILAGCGSSRADLRREAELKAIIKGWQVACLMAPAFMGAATEDEAGKTLQPCFDGYMTLYEMPNTRHEAEGVATAANACHARPDFRGEENVEKAIEIFWRCFDERVNVDTMMALGAGGGGTVHLDVDHRVRVGR